jgi:hypothetical protein
MQPVGVHLKFNVAFLFFWEIRSTIDSVIYLHVACIIQWGSEMMPWKIAISNGGIFTYTKRVPTSWDLGDSDPILYAAWNINQLQLSHLTWDPGGCTHRLEGKPNLKEGDCQLPYSPWQGWIVGRALGPWPALES